jgi:hypothetical protein
MINDVNRRNVSYSLAVKIVQSSPAGLIGDRKGSESNQKPVSMRRVLGFLRKCCGRVSMFHR